MSTQMSKFTDYLKHFFMLSPSAMYENTSYEDYTGPGFIRYKQSEYFVKPRIGKPGYKKAEVAAYSEMTKIALLIGIAFFLSACIYIDTICVRFLFGIGSFINELQGIEGNTPGQTIQTILPLLIGLGILNYISLTGIPKAVFLIKNFKQKTDA